MFTVNRYLRAPLATHGRLHLGKLYFVRRMRKFRTLKLAIYTSSTGSSLQSGFYKAEKVVCFELSFMYIRRRLNYIRKLSGLRPGGNISWKYYINVRSGCFSSKKDCRYCLRRNLGTFWRWFVSFWFLFTPTYIESYKFPISARWYCKLSRILENSSVKLTRSHRLVKYV